MTFINLKNSLLLLFEVNFYTFIIITWDRATGEYLKKTLSRGVVITPYYPANFNTVKEKSPNHLHFKLFLIKFPQTLSARLRP